MTVGTAIFLSAVILGAVALYGLTMDRWDWGRLGKAFADFGRMLLILGALIILALVVNQIDFKGRFIGYTYCEVQPTSPDCK
jgi:hypothetical protein